MREQLCDAIVAGSELNEDRALPGRGNECGGIERRAASDGSKKAYPVHAGDGEHSGIIALVEHCAHARIDIAADVADVEIRPRCEQLRAAARRARSDDRVAWQ